jgi:hypothetical protein
MLRTLLVIIISMAATVALTAQNFGQLQGKVTEEGTGEPVIFCSILLTKGGQDAGFTQTDIDGNYSIGNLDPGEYVVEISLLGYSTQRIEGVVINAGRVVPLNVKMSEDGLLLGEVVITDYEVPLVEQDNTTQGRTITGKEIRALPLKNINAIAASTAGVSTIDGESVAMRGSRANATDYYVDGIRVQGGLVPQFEIEQMQVITGGIEAMYGDVSGGVISITTKGPASKFGGVFEAETSEFLDSYGYNEINAQINGPLLVRDNKSIIGFRLSGRYLRQAEPNPPATGIYRASEETIRMLEEEPMRLAGTTPFSSAETLRLSDVELLNARPNNSSTAVDITGRIDARLSDAIDISVGGSYRNSVNQGGFGILNWTNSPFSYNQFYRTNFRFRHRLGFGGGTTADGERKPATIQNAVYTIQVGYEQGRSRGEDQRHTDNLFRYGHIGTYDFGWAPTLGEISGNDTMPFGHAGFFKIIGRSIYSFTI